MLIRGWEEQDKKPLFPASKSIVDFLNIVDTNLYLSRALPTWAATKEYKKYAPFK
jgi:hypothetical protein